MAEPNGAEARSVAFVIARDLHPTVDGRRARLKHVVAAACELGLRVRVVMLVRRVASADRDFCASLGVTVTQVAPQSGLRLLIGLAKCLLSGCPLQYAIFSQRRIASSIRAACRGCDVVYADMLRAGDGLRQPHSRFRLVLDIDEFLSDRYRQFDHGHHWRKIEALVPLPRWAVRAVARLLALPVNRWEATTMWRRERRCRRHADVVTMVSPADARRLASLPPRRGAPVVPLLLCGSFAHTVTRTQRPDPTLVGMIGNLTLESNRQGLQRFLLINADWLAADRVRIEIVGAHDDEAAADADAWRRRGVDLHLLGFVPDLRQATRRWLCGLAPIYNATGLNVKNLDYLALGLPIIGTRFAFRGLAAAAYLLAIDEGGFPGQLRLLRSLDDQAYDRLCHLAQAAYRQHHAPGLMPANLRLVLQAAGSPSAGC